MFERFTLPADLCAELELCVAEAWGRLFEEEAAWCHNISLPAGGAVHCGFSGSGLWKSLRSLAGESRRVVEAVAGRRACRRLCVVFSRFTRPSPVE